MMRFPHIAQQLFNVPLILQPEKAEIIVAALAERLGVTHLYRDDRLVFGPGEQTMLLGDDDDDSWESRRANYERGYDLCDGVAYVPIRGTLVQRLSCARPYSGMTGYDAIRHATLGALSDPQVRAVMLDIDSPGGAVAGGFDLVDTLYAARGIKPIWAMANENACSGGYAIASAADRIVLPRTGSLGSIGVVTMHVDMSGALAKDGMVVTLIHYGARKVDGSSTQPLADAARTRIQAHVDEIGELFVATVARNRDISAASVRKTEADVYMGEEAVDRGLADAVMPPDEAHRALLDSL